MTGIFQIFDRYKSKALVKNERRKSTSGELSSLALSFLCHLEDHLLLFWRMLNRLMLPGLQALDCIFVFKHECLYLVSNLTNFIFISVSQTYLP